MDSNENQHQTLNPSSYYHHHVSATENASRPSPTNGLLPHGDGPHVVYPHSVPSAVTAPLEPTKRRRGRPRKYGTPEQALAAKKTATSKERRELSAGSAPSSASRKSQLGLLGSAGQGFAPHVINVSPGEDVGQKIMLFMQQSKHEICILSASGSISNASLRQPAMSGGSIAYEGQFEIISLSGSYVRAEQGGRSGGLSICLSSVDGQIIGGGVGGPLKAAGPVQVIIGTFMMDTKKVTKSDTSGSSRLPSPVSSGLMLSSGYRPGLEPSRRNPNQEAEEQHQQHQGLSGMHFMMHNQGMHLTTPSRPTNWGASPDGRTTTGYDLTGWVRGKRRGLRLDSGLVAMHG